MVIFKAALEFTAVIFIVDGLRNESVTCLWRPTHQNVADRQLDRQQRSEPYVSKGFLLHRKRGSDP